MKNAVIDANLEMLQKAKELLFLLKDVKNKRIEYETNAILVEFDITNNNKKLHLEYLTDKLKRCDDDAVNLTEKYKKIISQLNIST